MILLIPGVLCAIISAKIGAGPGGNPITVLAALVALAGLGLMVFAVTRK
ncbi:hypothetical protein [Bradyrhizobium sp. NAS96.2]|nr:hypothetical protein [Bradyrhizobium sp. NAS96.2]